MLVVLHSFHKWHFSSYKLNPFFGLSFQSYLFVLFIVILAFFETGSDSEPWLACDFLCKPSAFWVLGSRCMLSHSACSVCPRYFLCESLAFPHGCHFPSLAHWVASASELVFSGACTWRTGRSVCLSCSRYGVSSDKKPDSMLSSRVLRGKLPFACLSACLWKVPDQGFQELSWLLWGLCPCLLQCST